MKTKNKFYWSEETINHFKFVSSYACRDTVEEDIRLFVEMDCDLEYGETEEDLSNDLIKQIFGKKDLTNLLVRELEELKQFDYYGSEQQIKNENIIAVESKIEHLEKETIEEWYLRIFNQIL